MANNNNNNNNNKKTQQTDISGLFSDFLKLCYDIDHEPKYSEKTSILAKNFKVWKGDVYLLCKLLLCKNDLRKYNIREKSAVKILSRYFNAPYQEMLSDLELGDMPETARKFYVKYGNPVAKSNITIKQVDGFLQELAAVRAEDAQYNVFSKFLPKVTADDLKMLMKIIDHDLKINIGPKYVLGALHPDAFTAYRNSNNLELIVERVMNQEAMEKKDGGGLFSDLGIDGNSGGGNNNNNNGDSKSDAAGGGGGFLTGLTLMIPVKPMLAKACHSMNEVISRCPNGMYSEIKYDGERIQIHKKGNEFKCFSRNLKPLPDWKVEQVKEFIPKATKADTIILDGEILLMDTKNHKPLPFGTLGVHKQSLYKDACVCVFLFDILYINGKVLLNKSLRKRRKIMEKHIKPVKFRVEFSEMTFINKEEDLCLMMTKVMQEGLEGLVIKDIKSIYEPGSRHWIKLKKDYLKGMADSADMVVIGANFGSGSKGGLMSTFLMGVHDPKTNKWKTVCKVGNGHDDDTLKSLQAVFKNKMNKVDRDFTRVPDWLDIHKSVVPDFIIKDPKKSAVWEVVGSEFTQSKKHTAAAISVRFPRVVRIRDDKDWKTATNLQELVDLSQASKADLKVSSSKKSKVTKKYKPITTDADESSSSEEDQAGSSSSKTNATTSIFSAPSKGNGNADDDDDDDMDDALPAGDAGVAASAAGASVGDKGKKAKYNQKVKINRPPRILYCGDGKEGQTDIGDKIGTPPPKLEGSKKINYMMGDVTSPSGTYLDENMIICHIADDSGKWSDKGVFAAISQKWEYPEQVFKKHPSVMGDAQVVKINNLNGKGNLYVATLIAQQSRSHKLNLESFVTCLKHLSKFALANNCSVHLPKLKMPNMNWSEIQGLLITYLVGKSVPTYVYTVGRDTGAKGKTAQPIIKKTGQDAGDKQPLAKKRSLDEEGFKSGTTNKKPKTDISSTTTTTTTSSKPDQFVNPFPYDYDGGELDEEEDEDIDEESDHERGFGKGDYDNDEESDEEAENMRSLILEDFVLSQHSSGGTLDWSGVGPKDKLEKIEMEKENKKENEDSEGSGNMDDTISMDSEELEAITRSASVYASMTASDSDNDNSKITKNKNKNKNKTNNDNENNTKQTKKDVKPLKNVRIVFSGFSSEREMDLAKKARELGAEISPQWFQIGPLRCSHLICAQHTSVVDSVLMMGGTAYTEKWLLDSYNAKARQPESPYIFNKKQTPPSSSSSNSSSSSSNNSNSSSNSNSHVPPSSVAPSSSSHSSSNSSHSSAPVPPPDVPFHKPITTVHLPQIFTDLVIYVFGSCDKSTELCSLIAKHGGTVISQINEDVTHILSANGGVEGSLREECPDACVVSPKWAWDSIKKQALLSERPFLIK